MNEERKREWSCNTDSKLKSDTRKDDERKNTMCVDRDGFYETSTS